MISYIWLTNVSLIRQSQILDVFLSAFLNQKRETSELLSKYFEEKIIPRLQKDHHICVALYENEIVGFVIFESWEIDSYYLAEMAISPQHQGKSIGKHLVFSIFEKDSNAKKIVLITEQANKWSQSFYEKIGFHKSSFSHSSYPNGFLGYEYLLK